MVDKLNIAAKYIDSGYRVKKVLQILKIHKTTWYRHQSKPAPLKDNRTLGRPIPGFSLTKFGSKVYDETIIEKLQELRQHQYLIISGGYIKLRYYLKRKYGYIVNKKKIYRLCKENKLLLPRTSKRKHTRIICCNRKISKPHQVWEFDIKYGYIHGENRFFYLMVYIDIFSRAIVHYHVGLTCKATNLTATLSTALRKSNISPEDDIVIRSDNGPQMTSKIFYKYLLELENKITHEFIPCATPNKNAHVESFYSIIELEFMQAHYFNNIKEVYHKLRIFIDHYNNFRVHSSLNYRSPNEVLEMVNSGVIPNDIKRLNI